MRTITIMMVTATAAASLLTGCAASAPQARNECPDPWAVAPPSVADAAYMEGLTERLAGPDRENTIVQAIGEVHRRAPQAGNDTITNILIAADCPNVARKPDHSEAAERDRIAGFRAQVDQILAQ